MKCSAYIATSVDGFIATLDGGVDWLHTSGNGKKLSEENADMGFGEYLSTVDCIIMGRKCMETISNMNLSPEQWPYGKLPIIVLSNTLKVAPDNMKDRIELFSGDLISLLTELQKKGLRHAYIDGGATIQSFINLKLLNEITVTKVPLLLGEGIKLFGKVERQIILENSSSKAYVNDFVQLRYSLRY